MTLSQSMAFKQVSAGCCHLPAAYTGTADGKIICTVAFYLTEDTSELQLGWANFYHVNSVGDYYDTTSGGTYTAKATISDLTRTIIYGTQATTSVPLPTLANPLTLGAPIQLSQRLKKGWYAINVYAVPASGKQLPAYAASNYYDATGSNEAGLNPAFNEFSTMSAAGGATDLTGTPASIAGSSPYVLRPAAILSPRPADAIVAAALGDSINSGFVYGDPLGIGCSWILQAFGGRAANVNLSVSGNGAAVEAAANIIPGGNPFSGGSAMAIRAACMAIWGVTDLFVQLGANDANGSGTAGATIFGYLETIAAYMAPYVPRIWLVTCFPVAAHQTSIDALNALLLAGGSIPGVAGVCDCAGAIGVAATNGVWPPNSTSDNVHPQRFVLPAIQQCIPVERILSGKAAMSSAYQDVQAVGVPTVQAAVQRALAAGVCRSDGVAQVDLGGSGDIGSFTIPAEVGAFVPFRFYAGPAASAPGAGCVIDAYDGPGGTGTHLAGWTAMNTSLATSTVVANANNTINVSGRYTSRTIYIRATTPNGVSLKTDFTLIYFPVLNP